MDDSELGRSLSGKGLLCCRTALPAWNLFNLFLLAVRWTIFDSLVLWFVFCKMGSISLEFWFLFAKQAWFVEISSICLLLFLPLLSSSCASICSASLMRECALGFSENFGFEWMFRFLCSMNEGKPFQRNDEVDSSVPNGAWCQQKKEVNSREIPLKNLQSKQTLTWRQWATS